MKKIFLLNNTIYTVENGELIKFGVPDKLEHITGDVFKGKLETFVVKDNKISVLAKGVYPMPVVDQLKDKLPQELKDLRDDHQRLVKHFNEKLGKLAEKYYEMCAQFSQKDFENLVKTAVVFPKQNGVSLYLQDKNGNYTEEKSVVSINFEDHPVFVYKGGLYARDFNHLAFNRIDCKLLLVAPEYIILWGGNKNIFAMSLDENGSVNFKPLGTFDELIKTDVNQLIRVGDRFSGWTFYHLGRKLEYVVSFDEIKDCSINQENGEIVHNYDFTVDGVDYPTTTTYKLVNGSYKPKQV